MPPRNLAAIGTQIVGIRITAPGQITELDEEGEKIVREVEGRIRIQYVDTYSDGEVKIDTREDKTIGFSDLVPSEEAALLNLIRVLEDESKFRLGLG